MTRAKCTDEIGQKILREFCNGESVDDVCARHGVSREDFYRWRRMYRIRLRSMDHMNDDTLHCAPSSRLK